MKFKTEFFITILVLVLPLFAQGRIEKETISSVIFVNKTDFPIAMKFNDGKDYLDLDVPPHASKRVRYSFRNCGYTMASTMDIQLIGGEKVFKEYSLRRIKNIKISREHNSFVLKELDKLKANGIMKFHVTSKRTEGDQDNTCTGPLTGMTITFEIK